MSAEAAPKAKLPTPTLDIRRLSGRFPRGDFVCGEAEIDRWAKDAHKHHSALKARVVTAHLKGNPSVAGFYGLTVRVESDEDIAGHGGVFRTQNRYFSAVQLCHIGVRRSLQERGIGSLLMAHAIREFGQVAMRTGICALTLVAINEERATWYEENWRFKRYGTPSSRPKMFFPAQAAIDLIEQNPE